MIRPVFIQEMIRPAFTQRTVSLALIQEMIRPAFIQEMLLAAFIQEMIRPAFIQEMITTAACHTENGQPGFHTGNHWTANEEKRSCSFKFQQVVISASSLRRIVQKYFQKRKKK